MLELKNVTEKPLPPLSDAYDTCASERATQHNRRRRTNGDARERALLATYVHRLVNVTDKVRDERQGARLGRGAGGADARLDRGAALVEDRRVVEDRRHDAAVVARWEHLEEGRVVCATAAIVQSLGYGGELCRARSRTRQVDVVEVARPAAARVVVVRVGKRGDVGQRVARRLRSHTTITAKQRNAHGWNVQRRQQGGGGSGAARRQWRRWR